LLFLPEKQPSKLPLVIMAHGTSATVSMVADKFADTFAYLVAVISNSKFRWDLFLSNSQFVPAWKLLF
jgi:hypothetical protein